MRIETVQLYRGKESAIVNTDDVQTWAANGWGSVAGLAPELKPEPPQVDSVDDSKRPRGRPRKP